MSTFQNAPTKKESGFPDLKLRFWGGKNTVMGGGLLAEVLMWSKEYDNERRRRKYVKRAALTAAKSIEPMHTERVERVAGAQVTANGHAEPEGAEAAELGNQDDALAEKEVNAINSPVCNRETQPHKPASPAPSKASSNTSHHASNEAQLPEAAKSPGALTAASTVSSAESHPPSRADLAGKPSTPPAPSEAPSHRSSSSRSVPPPAPNAPEELAQGEEDASKNNSKNGASGDLHGAPGMRGGAVLSKEQVSPTTSRKDRVSMPKLTVSSSSRNTASNGKELLQQRPSPSSQRPSETPTQPRQPTTSPTSLSVLSAPPKIPQLYIPRSHSIHPESSASCQNPADPPAPVDFTRLGRNWEKAPNRLEDPHLASKRLITTANENVWKWDDGQHRKQPTQAPPKPDTAPLLCNRCGAPCPCVQEQNTAHLKASSPRTPASHGHVASQALDQTPAASRAPSEKTSFSQSPAPSQQKGTAQAPATIYDGSRPPSQLQASNIENQHSSRSSLSLRTTLNPPTLKSPRSPRSHYETFFNMSSRRQNGYLHPIPVHTHTLLESPQQVSLLAARRLALITLTVDALTENWGRLEG